MFWVYRWKGGAWQAWPLVEREHAYAAIRAAALVFQREHDPPEGIELSHVQVRAVSETLPCVVHDQGSCALAQPPAASSKRMPRRVATWCDHWVYEPEPPVWSLPDCELCMKVAIARAVWGLSLEVEG